MPEEGTQLWEQLYGSLGFHVDDDEANDFALRKLCEALCGPMQPVYDLVRERDDQVGYTILLDPATCPAAFLPYLAQYPGVIPTAEMSEAQLRLEIETPTGWSRGRTSSIKVAAGRGLTGTQLVIVKPRTPEVWHHYVRTLLAETPDPTRTETTIRAATPAWEALDYEAFVGMTYADSTAKFSTYALRSAAYPTYADATEETP